MIVTNGTAEKLIEKLADLGHDPRTRVFASTAEMLTEMREILDQNRPAS